MNRSPGTLLLVAATLFCSACYLAGCDTFESDLTPPSADISDEALYVLSTGETIVDLNALVSANFHGRLSVTELPLHGSLQNIADGLLRYTPDNGTARVRDRFELTVYAPNNSILNKDTVYINIETDSAKLPCRIYPMADYATLAGNNTITTNVLKNDLVCGKTVTASVYQPSSGTFPRYGTAQADGNLITYTAGPDFADSDTVIYKVADTHHPASFAYGFIYITRDSVCNFTLVSDQYKLNALSENHFLDVFSNDILCDSIDAYTVGVAVPPANGTLVFNGRGFDYLAPVQADMSDEFTYFVSDGTTQRTARVVLRGEPSGVPCTFKALNDSIDIMMLSTSIIHIDVLKNDRVCDTLKTFNITRLPQNGTAVIDAATQRIRYERVVIKSDSLQYEICNGKICSKASVYIKQDE